MRRIRFKMSPELGDGQNAEICDDPTVVLERIRIWLDEFQLYPGEFSVETVWMSDAEVEALPEI